MAIVALAALVAALWLAAAPSAETVTAKTVVGWAQAYLEQWEPALAAIVAEEQYEQALDEFSRAGINRHTTRRLVSDVLLVRAPKDPIWLLFRDVLSVDDEPVRDRQHRFDALFTRPEGIVAGARRIAAESARYNLGRLARNLNTPAAALIFLRRPFAESTAWKDLRSVDVAGVRSWQLSFTQNRAPYAIHSVEGEPQPAAGRLWIEPDSGRILKTELEIWTVRGRSAAKKPRAWVMVVSHFGPVHGLDVWVPRRMEERYQVYTEANQIVERVEAEATYTNHRRFQTAARIIGGPP